jgi:hypothetical protein
MKTLLEYTGSFLLVIFVIAGSYYYSSLTGGELTSATSCTSMYLKEEYTIDDLRKQCPNLKKDAILEDIEIYFKTNNLNSERKETLKNEVIHSFE